MSTMRFLAVGCCLAFFVKATAQTVATWNGGNGTWNTTSDSWLVNNSAAAWPANGSAIFPVTPSLRTVTLDNGGAYLPVYGLRFDDGGYTLERNTATDGFTLGAGGIVLNSGTGHSTINNRLTLSASTSITNNSGSYVDFGGFVDVGPFTLNVGGSSLVYFQSSISGTGDVTVNGTSSVVYESSPTYTGTTRIAANGTLVLNSGVDLATTNLAFAGASAILRTDNATYSSALGTAAGQVRWGATADGGFAADTKALTVNLGGAGATLTTGANGFVPSGKVLRLNDSASTAPITFANPINLAVPITVSATDGTSNSSAYAVLEGAITGSADLTKAGSYLAVRNATGFSGRLIFDGEVKHLTSSVPTQKFGFGKAGGLQAYGEINLSNITFSTSDYAWFLSTSALNLSGTLNWASNGPTTFHLSNSSAAGGIDVTGAINLAPGVWNNISVLAPKLDGSPQVKISGPVTGAGGLWKTGVGELLLTNTSNSWGYTAITEGTLTFTNTGATTSVPFSASLITVGNGALLQHQGTGSGDTFSSNLYLGSALFSGAPSITFEGSGGLGARSGYFGAALYAVVNNNAVAPVWGSTPGFIPNGKELQLNNSMSDGVIVLTAPIDLGGQQRLIRVTDNPNSTADYGAISGTLSNGGIQKVGDGRLKITSTTNSYTGLTSISEGVLSVWLTPTPSLPASSHLALAGGVLETDFESSFTRSLGAGAGQLSFQGDGGFAANGSALTVNLGGNADIVGWGIDHFARNGKKLLFGSTVSDSPASVTFANPIDLTGGSRTIEVVRGPNDTSTVARLSGVVSNGSLNKSGNGVLELAAANTFNDILRISAGTVRLGVNNALAADLPVIMNGGVLDVNSKTQTIGTISGTTSGSAITRIGSLSIGSGTLAVPISGSGSLTKVGSGTLLIKGDSGSTYTGGTRVSGGTLQINGAGGNALPNTGTVTVDAGATFDLAGNSEQIGHLTGAGNVTLGSGSLSLNMSTGVPFSGTISGTGGLNLSGSGTLELLGVNTFSGPTTVSNGAALSLGTSNALSQSPLTLNTAGYLYVASGVSVTLGSLAGGGNSTAPSNITLLSGSKLIVGGDNTNTQYSGAISNFGGVSKVGSGSLLLSGTRTYTGATRVDAGDLQVTHLANGGLDSSIGKSSNSAANLVIADGGVLNPRLTYVGASNSSTDRLFTIGTYGASILSDGTGTVSFTNAGPIAFAGAGARSFFLRGGNTGVNVMTPVIGDASGGATYLTKFGAGRWKLAGNNTYTGATTISAGTLEVTSLADGGLASNLGSSSNAAANLVLANSSSDARLLFTGGISLTDRLFTIGSGGAIIDSSGGRLDFTNPGPIAFANSGARTFYLQGSSANSNTFAPLIGDGGGPTALTKFGAGHWAVTGSNTYTGPTTIYQGTFSVDSLNNGGSPSNIGASGSSAANLVLGASAGASGGLVYYGAGSSTDRLFTIGLGGAIIHAGGTGPLNFTNPGAVALSGQGARTLVLQGSNTDSNRLTAALGDNGGPTSVTKKGTGTWILAGNNTYSGDTTVTDGILRLGSATALPAASALVVSVPGVLDVNGFAISAGALTANGEINLGNGSLTVGSLNLSTEVFGVISGTGALVKTGSGVLTLSGLNTYTGATTISSGTLTVNSLGAGGQPSSIGASSNSYGNLIIAGSGPGMAGTLRYVGPGASTDRNFAIGNSGATIDASGTGPLSFTNPSSFGFLNTGTRTLILQGEGPGTNAFAPQILDNFGATSFTKAGSGSWWVANANAYTGVTRIDGGSLRVEKLANGGNPSGIGAAPSAASNLIIADGPIVNAALIYQGVGDSTDRLFTIGTKGASLYADGSGPLNFSNSGAIAFTGTGSRSLFFRGDNTGNNTFAPLIGDPSGGATYVGKIGSGKWLVTGANTYTGATTIVGGTLAVSALANGGSPSGIGASTSEAANLQIATGGDGASLLYTGPVASTNRLLSIGSGGAALDASGTGPISFNNSAPLGFTNTGARTFYLQGSNTGANTFALAIGDNGGSTHLTKFGSGTWVLSGSNSYSGATTVYAGTLRLGSAAALPAGSAVNVKNGATLDLNGYNASLPPWTEAGNLALGSGTATLGSGNTNSSLTGVISGSGGFTKIGTGSLTLGDANTYSGVTRVDAGDLFVTSLKNGGTVSSLGSSNNAAANLVIADGGSPNVSLIYTGPGDTTDRLFTIGLFGASIFADGTGALQFANTGSIGFSGTGARSFYLRGDSTANNVFAPLIGDAAGASTYLTKFGGSRWRLTNANTYTGSTTVANGILSVDSLANGGAPSGIGASSSAAANLVLASSSTDATLQYLGSANATTDRLLTIGNGGAILDASGAGTLSFSNSGAIAFANTGARTFYLQGTNTGANTFAPVIGDNGGPTALTKFSAGRWVLTAPNTYTGATTLYAGTLSVSSLAPGGAASSIGASGSSAANLIFRGGTLDYTGSGGSTDRLFTIGAGDAIIGASGAGALQFTNTGSVAYQAAGPRMLYLWGTSTSANTFAPLIGDNGADPVSLTKYGTGNWVLTAAHTYTGPTKLDAGTLTVSTLSNGGSPSNLGASSNSAANLVFRGGTLRYTGNAASTDRLFSVGVSGATLDASGTGALVFSNTGPVAFNGQNGARTLTLTGTSTAGNTLAAQIGDNNGATSLTKSGNGTWVLSAANSFSGGTTLAGGTLRLTNTTGSALGTGAVTVNAGALLTGPGAFSGNLVLNGTYAPGSSPALVALPGSFTVGSTGHVQIEIGGATRGVNYDAIDIGGTLNAGGTLDVSFIDGYAPTGPATFSVFTFAAEQGTFTSVNLPALAAGLAWDTSKLHVNGTLAVVAQSAYATWQQSHFTPTELANPAISGPLAVTSSDGLTNLVKYALGLDPKTTATTGLPAATSDTNDWIYNYTKSANATNVTVEVQYSGNLTSWSTTGISNVMLSNAGGVETWQARLPRNIAPSPAVFFRLKVTSL